ncbi:MAG TPA: DUF3575 domain-containing protein [Bacteroidales bacterium]
MKSTTFLLLALILIFQGSLIAQSDSVAPSPSTMVTLQTEQATSFENNIIKLNVTALFVKNFTVQYERIIKKYLSGAISVRYMPNGSLPYKNFFYNQFGDDDPEAKETIENMKVNNFAVTPEVRFYVGKKGFGQGFYIAPSYRYAKFNVSNIEYNYNDDEDENSTILMSGKLSSNYGGFVIGAQWLFGSHVTLDWWIFGPLFGVENSNFNGNSDYKLTAEDKAQIIENVNDIDIPGTTTEVSFPDDYSVSVQLHGPIYGVAFGLAVGFRF